MPEPHTLKKLLFILIFVMEDFDASMDEVESLLDSDIGGLDGEIEVLYNDIEYFAELASVYDSQGDSDYAEVFEDLAVLRYEAFMQSLQLDKYDRSE